MNDQTKEIKIIANTALKAVVLICICVMVAISLNSCELESNLIADCKDACDSSSSQMESVTKYKCTCIDKDTKKSPWVLN
jgi:hypothetical protein